MDDIVASACDQMGLDGGDACLVQHAANALFRLSEAGVMLRLSPQPVDRLVRVARELSAAGVPVADLAPGVPQPIAGLLLARCDEIERELATVTWTLPVGTIHADAHTGNLLRTAAGRVLLCDLDTVASGPRETDLVPVAHGVARFGRDRDDYESFVDQYGFDLLGAPSWPTLSRLRDLQLAIYMLPRPPADPTSTGELAHRLRTVLNGDDSAHWYRFPAFF